MAPVSQSTTNNALDIDGSGNALNIPFNNSSMLDIDLFSDSDMQFDWTSQVSTFEPLEEFLLNRLSPVPLPQSETEDNLSPSELSILHSYYFDSIYFSFPFLYRARFDAESSGTNRGSAIMALIYAVALAGCTHCSAHHDKKSTCYRLSRDYAEQCEREGQLNDLNLLEALLFIGRFEAMEGKLDKSWMTLGRAAMLSKLMELHQLDDDTGRSQHPHTTDQVLLEERRRTLWALYILQSYVKTRTERGCMLGDVTKFRIRLPSPGLLTPELVPLKMPFLSDIDIEPMADISSYAGCVLMVELALNCFSHTEDCASNGFWDGYCALVKKTDQLFGTLKEHLNATSIRNDPVAFSLYLNLRATEIFCHESAITRSQEQGLPPLMTAESQRRATAAAFQISTAVRLNLPSPGKFDSDIIRLQAIFIAWPLTMALKAFHRELVHGDSRDTVNGVVASSRLLFAALDHIEESGGHWHTSVAHVERKLQELEERNSFTSLAS
ncbi:hypothetical protein FBEOM_9265 [Fusarium beomiforme]|uniref:Xylanolytic transcriptional activator regulatory domain-containing protein n=1 Tax=Fusarium beomiforme TaxID=44412 RepID=A0A9P5ADK7_9HYPO|nr:hypothetical protein FBEOM_9265 [Fusarium beomiforme]